MRSLIDQTVVNAEGYYRAYMREPSPAGDITIGPNEIIAVPDINLEFVLDQMKQVGKNGELLIVTHSQPKGLKMPVAKGSVVSAWMDTMQSLLKVRQGMQRKESIEKLPAQKQLEAWKEWFKEFDPAIKIGDDVTFDDQAKKFVENKYEEWFLRQGGKILGLPNPKVTLQRLINLLNEVRDLKFQRLEFRACRIGTDPNALKIVANFFNAIKVVAPKEVRTFYGMISKVDIVSDPKRFTQQMQAFGAPVVGGVHHRKRGNPARVFQDLIVPAGGFHLITAFRAVPTIGLEIGAKSFRVVALGTIWVKVFVSKHICPNYSGSVSPLFIGGLEPAGQNVLPGKVHVFPLEPEYNALLAVHEEKQTTP